MLRSLKKLVAVFVCFLMISGIAFSYNTSAVVASGSENKESAGYEFASENEKFTLFADKKSGQFYVEDKGSGVRWYSNPAVKDEDKTSAVFKMEQSSLILINSYDETAKILSKSNSEAMSVRKGGTKFKTVDKGFEITYSFSGLDIEIPLRITLSSEGFTASVPIENIKEKSNLFGISVLPYFAAGYPDDSGYALLPDGSGSLMHFGNERQSAADYRVHIYGRDALSSAVTKPQESYNANMPVFGIKNSEGIAFAIIEKGAAHAAVNAVPNNKSTPYAICYADFSLRGTDTVILGEATGSAQSYLMYQKDGISIDGVEIKYNLVSDKDADYNTMAEIYRSYLIKKYGMQEKSGKNQPICLEFYGAVKKKKSFLGVPFTVTQRLSEISEISAILGELSDAGISDISIVLKEWTKQQLAEKADSKLSLVGSVGNKSELKALLSKVEENNGKGYMGVVFQEAARSGSGVSVFRDTVRNISNMPAGRYTFKINTLIKDNSTARNSFLRLTAQEKLMGSIVKSASRLGIDGLFLSSPEIYTDYGKKTVSRAETVKGLSALLGKTAEEKTLMIEFPPEYSLGATEFALNVPMTSNGYTATDTSIPFYQLAVSGLIDYASEPINLSGDVKTQLLRCLETGSALHYTFITEDNTVVEDTSLEGLYSCDFGRWKDNLKEYYRITAELYKKTEGGKMIKHTVLSDNITCTTYENGCRVYVNYTDRDFDNNGTVIPSNSYLITGEKEEANEQG